LTRLGRGEPIPEPHTEFLDTLHTSNPCGQLGTEQASVRSLISESPNSRESSIDCPGCQMTIFQADAIPGHNGFVERQTRLRTIPLNEVIDGVAITALRLW